MWVFQQSSGRHLVLSEDEAGDTQKIGFAGTQEHPWYLSPLSLGSGDKPLWSKPLSNRSLLQLNKFLVYAGRFWKLRLEQMENKHPPALTRTTLSTNRIHRFSNLSKSPRFSFKFLMLRAGSQSVQLVILCLWACVGSWTRISTSLHSSFSEGNGRGEESCHKELKEKFKRQNNAFLCLWWWRRRQRRRGGEEEKRKRG